MNLSRFSTGTCAMNYPNRLSRFRLLFAGDVVNMRRADDCLTRFEAHLPLNRSPFRAASPVSARKRYGSIVPHTFGLKIEHELCASVRGLFTGCPGETNALAKASFPGNGAGSRSRRREEKLVSEEHGPPEGKPKALDAFSEREGVQDDLLFRQPRQMARLQVQKCLRNNFGTVQRNPRSTERSLCYLQEARKRIKESVAC